MPALILTCQKKTHIILVHLADLENGINLDIDTHKKYRGDIFSECCTETFKEIFIHYVNEVIFEMVKTALNYTYLGGKTPTALQNEVSTCRKCIMIERLALLSINR